MCQKNYIQTYIISNVTKSFNFLQVQKPASPKIIKIYPREEENVISKISHCLHAQYPVSRVPVLVLSPQFKTTRQCSQVFPSRQIPNCHQQTFVQFCRRSKNILTQFFFLRKISLMNKLFTSIAIALSSTVQCKRIPLFTGRSNL